MGAVLSSVLQDVSGTPGLHPLDACSTSPEWWLPEMTDIVQCPLVGRIPPELRTTALEKFNKHAQGSPHRSFISTVSVTRGQPQSKNTKWKIPEINNSSF